MNLKFLNTYNLFKQKNQNTDVIVYLEYDSDFNHLSTIVDCLIAEKKKF